MTKIAEMEKSKKTRILLVEDHPMFRDQLASLIGSEPDMEVCGQADNIRDAMEIAQRTKPDVAIVDVTLKGVSGLEFIKDLRAQDVQIPILVLSMHEESLYAERVLQAGARGYVSKSQPSSEVMKAIRKVMMGDVYLSEDVTTSLLKRMADRGATSAGIGVQSLTDRELEIFQMIGRGHNMAAIAQNMNLSPSTVETYRTRIRGKLGVKNAAALYSVAATWVRDKGS
ncbi:MAG: response regulator transcription factor [Chthoniobacteraceae bacterium]